MKQVISHHTRDLTIGGKIDQDIIHIGTGTAQNVGIYFDNGQENLPGIRFYKDDNDEYIIHFDASGGLFNSVEVSWPADEEAVFYYVKDDSATGNNVWLATASTGALLGLTGNFTTATYWMITASQNAENPNYGPIIAESVSRVTSPDQTTWRNRNSGTIHENVCTVEHILPTQEWQYSINGVDWLPIPEASNNLIYDPITILVENLNTAGSVTIQHNLGTKYPIGLDYTVTPDEIEFIDDNSFILNFSKQPATSFPVQVWFINSKQNMLVTQGDEA